MPEVEVISPIRPSVDVVDRTSTIAVAIGLGSQELIELALSRDPRLADQPSQSVYFKEFVYSAGVLSQIKYWDSSSKASLYLTKTFFYTSGLLTSITIQNFELNITINRVFAYTGGVLSSESKS